MRSASWSFSQVMNSLTVGLLLAGTGCSSSAPLPEYVEKLVPISGTLQLDGEPLNGATIVFHPENSPGAETAYGVTVQEGALEVKTMVPGQKARAGIVPGTYTVTAFKLAMPDGSPVPKEMTDADAEAEGARHVVPKVYLEPTTSPLQVEITPQSGPLTLELSSKARPRPQ